MKGSIRVIASLFILFAAASTNDLNVTVALLIVGSAIGYSGVTAFNKAVDQKAQF